MNRQNNETRRTVLRRTAGRAAVAVLLAACMLASGCAKEFEEVTGGAGGGKRIEVSFDVPQMDEVRVETRMTVENNLVVENLWVIQLNEAGTALLQPSIYISKVLDNRVNLNLTDQRSMIIFIANTFDKTLFSGATTAAQVTAVTQNFSSYSDFIVAPDYLSCCFKGTPDELNAALIKLVRCLVRLDFFAKSEPANNEQIKISTIKLCNVPKTVHFYRDPDKLDPGTTASATYPATTSGFIGVWDTKYGSSNGFTWYLPENCRGKGTATREEDKTAAKALGGASGQGNYATYIEITADVTLDDGTFFKDVKYRVYLGSDAVSDYNLKRNTRYIVNCSIRGVNKLDARVTVGTPTYPGDYYDYTDNRTGRFLIAKSDATNGTAVNWNNGRKLCKDGWRLPTAEEMGMLSALSGNWWTTSYGFKSEWYHTSTFNGVTSNQRLAFNYATWGNGAGPTTDNAHVRCVKDLPSGGKKYPYVTTDNQGKRTVIVFREGNNGVKSAVIRANISSTESIGSWNNKNWRLPSKLQVAQDSRGYDYWQWKNSTALCHNYRGGGYSNWRLPNPREAFMIGVLLDELDVKVYERIYTSAMWTDDDGSRPTIPNSIRTQTWYQSIYPKTNWKTGQDYNFVKVTGSLVSWVCEPCRKTKAEVVCVRDA